MTTSSLVCKLCGETDASKFRQRIVSGKTYYVNPCRACENRVAIAYHNAHKEERAQYQKSYIKQNKDVIKEKKKKYDKERYPSIQKEKIIQSKEYAKNNKALLNSNKKLRRQLDPAYRLRHYISGRIRKILKQTGYKKNDSCLKYLDYSFHELKSHIEILFEPWMTWDNHGNYNSDTWNDDNPFTWTWQLDHIIPQSDLPYTNMVDDNFKKCWALNNLRPLSAKLNVIEGTNRTRHDRSNKPIFKIERIKN